MFNDSTNWVIVVFASLFGLGVVYSIARMIIASVSPETNNQIEQYFIARDVKRHFRFLLKRGYKISHLEHVPHHYAGWHFQLESPDNNLSIILDQQERPWLAFEKVKTDKQSQISLEAMIYYLTERKVFIGNSYNSAITSRSQVFKNTAKLLRRYVVQIEKHLRDHSESIRNELGKIQEQYDDLLVEEFEQRLKSRQH